MVQVEEEKRKSRQESKLKVKQRKCDEHSSYKNNVIFTTTKHVLLSIIINFDSYHMFHTAVTKSGPYTLLAI